MSAVCLYDNRVARSECCGGVAARNREGEGKIARTKNDHPPNRDGQTAKIRLWDRLTVGNSVIDARIHPGAFARHLREQPELAHSARAFTGQTCLRKPGFLVCPLDERIAQSNDLIGDSF